MARYQGYGPTATGVLMKTIMVTGSRDWTDLNVICNALQEAVEDLGEPVRLIHGDCPTGADAIADKAWRINLPVNHNPIKPFPADWNKFGKFAGPKRNQEMVDTRPDIVLAFPLGISPGTRGTIKKAQEAGLEVRIY